MCAHCRSEKKIAWKINAAKESKISDKTRKYRKYTANKKKEISQKRNRVKKKKIWSFFYCFPISFHFVSSGRLGLWDFSSQDCVHPSVMETSTAEALASGIEFPVVATPTSSWCEIQMLPDNTHNRRTSDRARINIPNCRPRCLHETSETLILTSLFWPFFLLFLSVTCESFQLILGRRLLLLIPFDRITMMIYSERRNSVAFFCEFIHVISFIALPMFHWVMSRKSNFLFSTAEVFSTEHQKRQKRYLEKGNWNLTTKCEKSQKLHEQDEPGNISSFSAFRMVKKLFFFFLLIGHSMHSVELRERRHWIFGWDNGWEGYFSARKCD